MVRPPPPRESESELDSLLDPLLGQPSPSLSDDGASLTTASSRKERKTSRDKAEALLSTPLLRRLATDGPQSQSPNQKQRLSKVRKTPSERRSTLDMLTPLMKDLRFRRMLRRVILEYHRKIQVDLGKVQTVKPSFIVARDLPRVITVVQIQAVVVALLPKKTTTVFLMTVLFQ